MEVNFAFIYVLLFACVSACQGFVVAPDIKSNFELHSYHGNDLHRARRLSYNSRRVCYDLVGCFNNSSPFTNDGTVLPDKPERVGTQFRLYTRSLPNNTYAVLTYFPNDTSVTNSTFNSKVMTRVVIHGYVNSGDDDWVQNITNAFLHLADENIIVVDWRAGAGGNYEPAVANTRLVSTQLRLLLERLMREAGLDLDKVHLIGHSLGAHTSGDTGRQLGGRVARITGMDPAGPNFDAWQDPAVYLDKTDAQFVDAIHTNGKPLAQGGAGNSFPAAHVDFFVNGGQTQPGCVDGVAALFHGGMAAAGCSHGRSHDLFLASITSECSFTAYPCQDYNTFQKGQCLDCEPGGCTEMGLYADQHPARGIRYLNTLGQSPYCGFHYLVTIHAAPGRNTKGTIFVTLSGAWGTTGVVQVTGKEETLKQGVDYVGVMVSSVEVGRLRTLSIRYDKAPAGGGLFGSSAGLDTFPVKAVDIMSGENGKIYTFCPQQSRLQHAQQVTLTVSDTGSC